MSSILYDINKSNFISSVLGLAGLFFSPTVLGEKYSHCRPIQEQNPRAILDSYKLPPPKVILFGYNYLLFKKGPDGEAIPAPPLKLDDQCLLLSLALDAVLKYENCKPHLVAMASDLPNFGDPEKIRQVREKMLDASELPKKGYDLISAFNEDISIRTRMEKAYAYMYDKNYDDYNYDKPIFGMKKTKLNTYSEFVLWALESEYRNPARKDADKLLDSRQLRNILPNGLPKYWAIIDDAKVGGMVHLRYHPPSTKEPLDIPIVRRGESWFNPLCPLVFTRVLKELTDPKNGMGATHFIGIFRDDEVATANFAILVAREVFGVNVTAIVAGIDSNYSFTQLSLNGRAIPAE